MKKNKMMRLASVLLLCVLMTTSVISGTFAKYTTSTTGKDAARVAKWGFEAPAAIEITDLFKNAYKTTDTSILTATNSVVSSNEEDVIAPGTENSAQFSFAYDTESNDIKAPEVGYMFTVLATTTADWEDYKALDANKNFNWTLTYPDGDVATYGKFEDLLAAINELDGVSGKAGKAYRANELPKEFYGETPNGAATYTIGWAWEFFTDADHDAVDTKMGNADNLANIDITITITATQIN